MMKPPVHDPMSFGAYTGFLDETYRAPDFMSALEGLAGSVAAGPVIAASRRNRLVRLALPCNGETVELAVKCFGEQPGWKGVTDRWCGTKAARSWRAANLLYAAGVGTPHPVGYLERWHGVRVRESYYLSVFEPGLSDFRRELIYIYREWPRCVALMRLMETVATAVRAMHNAGLLHRDLGNQNIHLRREGRDAWKDVQFIDLNRSRVFEALTMKQRARDLSRIYLPSDLRRVFQEMYFGGPVPDAYRRWDLRFRRWYALHSRTRKWRHPLRARMPQRSVPLELAYPDERDIWIWDDRSRQAVNVVGRPQRNRMRSASHVWHLAWGTLLAFPGVMAHYRRLRRRCYRQTVSMSGRVGVSIDPTPATLEQTRDYLEPLGRLPLLLRFYHHEDEAEWAFTADVVRELSRAGHPVDVALVQDRRAILEPDRWARFLSGVLEQVHAHVQRVEIGHAVNRAKWGIWGLAEYRKLLDPVRKLQQRYPGLEWTGPAGIDFEYPAVLAALRWRPRGVHFDALSHLLYVDRRGAPENAQGGFSTLEKAALARAIAGWAHDCDDRFLISEVNWPIEGAGVHSPIGSPYLYPGQQLASPPSTSEEVCADYLVRYLLITLCSGMASRVYWWNLASRGFGLVDDTDGTWRKRPAYQALLHFVGRLGTANFTEHRCLGAAECFLFEQPDGSRDAVLYAPNGACDVHLPWDVGEGYDVLGAACAACDPIRVTGRPVYLCNLVEKG